MKIAYLALFIFISSFANGQSTKSPAITRYIRLTGAIDKYPVTFHLHRINERFSGTYYYNSSEQPIGVFGQLGKDGILKLTAATDDPDHNETFAGAFKDSVFSGTWQFKTKKLNFRVITSKDSSGLSFDYIWTEGSKKIKPKEGMPSHLDELSFEASAVWPSAATTHPAKQLIQQVVREFFGAKDSKDEIGKILISQKNQMLNAKSTDDVELYESSSNVDIAYSNVRMICLSDGWSNYTGGAHGMYGTNYVNIDLLNNRKITLSDILDTAEAKEAVSLLLEQKFQKKFPGEQYEKLEDVLLVDKIPMNENFVLTSKGIGFNYQPYEIGAYAMGEIFLFIPFKDLQLWLRPSFKKYMGLK